MDYKRLYLVPLLVVAGIAAGAAGVSQWYVAGLLRDVYIKQTVMAARIATDALEHFQTLPTDQNLDALVRHIAEIADARVSLIADDGVMLADSALTHDELAALDNHATRPEVVAARKNGVGVSVRHSATLKQELMYVAVAFRNGSDRGVLRLALHSADLDAAINRERTWFFVLTFCGIFAVGGVGLMMVRGFVSRLRREREDLRHARDEAWKASQAKSEFLASMSHELRTPLNAILGFAQVIQFDPGSPLSATQKESLSFIQRGGRHLLKLVDSILELSVIESDRLPLELEDVNVREVVDRAITAIEPLGQPRDIEISSHLDVGLDVYLKTDRQWFAQALNNFLSNAVKYNRDGGTVVVGGRETDDGFFRVSVADTGKGIAADRQANIFEHFHRLDQNAGTAKDGVGISLAVTKALVERLGGRIGFDSKEGYGSTFWFELPLADNDSVLIWTKEMKTGMDVIDQDHQGIFALLNKLTNHAVTSAEMDRAVDYLLHYTAHHFEREELVMRLCGYPDLAHHRAEHRKIAQEAKDLVHKWKTSRDRKYVDDLQVFLRTLWTKHTLSEDVKVAPFTRGRQEQIRRALEEYEMACRARNQSVSETINYPPI